MTTGELDGTAVAAVGTALSTAVVAMWRRLTHLADQQIRTSEKLGRLEGKQDGIETMSARVLEEIHTIKSASAQDTKHD
tara:strand:+ start:1183 stop:1419 length:237 start_codon:yes stop_codon:yes gene_type:complete